MTEKNNFIKIRKPQCNKRCIFLLYGSSFYSREPITRPRQCLSQPITARQYLGIQHRFIME